MMTSEISTFNTCDEYDDCRMTYIELQRVLHVMEQDNHRSSNQTPASWYQARTDYCRSLFQKLRSFSGNQRSSLPIDALHERVMKSCQRSDHMKASLSSNSKDSNDMIRRLLFSSTNDQTKKYAKSTCAEEASEELVDHEEARNLRTATKDEHNTAAVSPEDLQEQQREQMEEAIRQMASQMKEETTRIHQTLRSQTANLNELENVTTENVEAVTEVAQDVTEHVRQGWSRSAGTWTLLFIIIGVFCLMLVTILMAPKRRDAPCLFLCGESPTRRPDQVVWSDEKFCRRLHGGSQECISGDSGQMSQKGTERVNEFDRPSPTGTNTASCQLSVDGECEDSIGHDVHDLLDHDSIGHDVQDLLDHFLDENIQNDGETAYEKDNFEEDAMETKPVVDWPKDDPVQSTREDVRSAKQKRDYYYSNGVLDKDGEQRRQGQRDDQVKDFAADGHDDDEITEGQPANTDGGGDVMEQEHTFDHNKEIGHLEQEIDRVDFDDNNDSGGDVEEREEWDEEEQEEEEDDDDLEEEAEDREEEEEEKDDAKQTVEASSSGDVEVPLFRSTPFSPQDVRHAAEVGDLESLAGYLEIRPDWGEQDDSNGWTAWHLAARAGNLETISILKSNLGGVSAWKTVDGRTALDVAIRKWGSDHPVAHELSS